MSNITVAIYNDFLTSLNELPLGIKNKTNDFINKFRLNPKDPSIHLEKLLNPYDDKFYSGSIDKTYRVIMAVQERTNTYVLLWVDNRDDAYKWASTKRIEVNKLTGLLQLYDVLPVKEENKVVNKIFDKYTNEQLLAIGVPEVQLPFVRSLITNKDFYANKKAFSNDVYEYLELLVNGSDYKEVLDYFHKQEAAEISDDFGNAIANNARAFTVVEGQEELNKMFDAPLEKWRIFLHPSQKTLVYKDFAGPASVLGEAGTGKTVVAMHRAKYLLSQNKKVLFTTFTSNLVGDIETNIMKILSLDEAKKLDIKGIDSIIISYLNSKGLKYKITYDDDKLLNYWDKAIEIAKEDLTLDSSFYMEEWRKVASVLDVLNVANYVKVSRGGRGIRLDRAQRLKVWHVFEEYMELLKSENTRDIDFATYEARQILKANPETPYDSIIVDEAQDISSNAFKFLRQYAGAEHENDMFIVGDSHQRIYKNKAILSKCGINTKGRTNVLKINYRTTEETRKYAFSLLSGINFNDIDTEYLGNTKCQSLTHGDLPVVKNFENHNDQFSFVVSEIKKLHESGVHYEDICVVGRTHKQIELASIALSKNSISFYEINSNKKDNITENGVRLATMHRVKGLEFRYVFVISVNKNLVPMLSLNVDEKDNEENYTIERCLLYVALTRAQIKAYVLSYGTPSSIIEPINNDSKTSIIKDEVKQFINKNLNNELDIKVTMSYKDSIDHKSVSLKNKTIKNILDTINNTFQQVMFNYIDTKQLDEVEVYNRAQIDRRLFSKIRSDINYKPSKKTAISICFGLMLDIDETIDLLEKAGFVLSFSSKFDIIVRWFIEKKNYDLMILNQVLFEYGEASL